MKNRNNIKKIEKQIGNDSPEVNTIIKIVIGVLVFFVIAYFLMAIVE